MRTGFLSIVATATMVIAPPTSLADTDLDPAARDGGDAGVADVDTAAIGEDELLYQCGKARSKVAVSFRPEVELADLVSWAMGLTCKNFVFSAAIAKRAARVTIIAPEKMSPGEAWRVFLVALQAMGLNLVPKGKATAWARRGPHARSRTRSGSPIRTVS